MHRCNNHCERIESSVLDAGTTPTSAIMGSAPFPQSEAHTSANDSIARLQGLGAGFPIGLWSNRARTAARGGSREQHVVQSIVIARRLACVCARDPTRVR